MSDPLERGWAEVQAAWDETTAHERLIALADATDRLAELARRYRAEKETVGGRAAMAERMLAVITTRALGRLASTPRDTPPSRRRLEWIALGVSVVLGAAALWQMLRVM